jgi:hypothetical protein
VGLWTRITGWVVSAWEGIKTFFASLWISIVATFTDVWNSIPGFFTLLWNGIVSIVTTVANWFSGVWQAVVNGFSAAWTWASNIFTAFWNGIVGVVTGIASWFGETFSFITGAFVAAWTWVSQFFVSIWEGIKGVVMGFVEWLSPVIDMIIAPFKAIGDVIGGIIGSVKGWFGETVEIGETELAKNGAKMKDAAAKPVQTAAPVPAAQIAAPPLTAPSVVSTPSLAASTAPIPSMEIVSPIVAAPPITATSAASTPSLAESVTASSSGNSLAMEHLEAARRKGVSVSDMSYTASSAFSNAGTYTPSPVVETVPVVDLQQVSVPAASNPFLDSLPTMPTAVQSPVVPPKNLYEDLNRQLEVLTPTTSKETVLQQTKITEQTSKAEPQNVYVDKVYVQADDCETALDFVRMIMQAAHKHQEALV